MEREISSGAMLGVVLLALAAVIGLGFGVFAIAKGVANDGTVGMQDSLASVSDQVFLDYDQKIVTGTQALASLKQFEGKPYAILYATRAGQEANPAFHPDHANVNTVTVNTVKYVNYNALIGGTGSTAIVKKNGAFIIDKLKAVAGAIEFDNVTEGLYKTGNAEYVKTSSKFDANVIKDKSNNYIGLVFEER